MVVVLAAAALQDTLAQVAMEDPHLVQALLALAAAAAAAAVIPFVMAAPTATMAVPAVAALGYLAKVLMALAAYILVLVQALPVAVGLVALREAVQAAQPGAVLAVLMAAALVAAAI